MMMIDMIDDDDDDGVEGYDDGVEGDDDEGGGDDVDDVTSTAASAEASQLMLTKLGLTKSLSIVLPTSSSSSSSSSPPSSSKYITQSHSSYSPIDPNAFVVTCRFTSVVKPLRISSPIIINAAF